MIGLVFALGACGPHFVDDPTLKNISGQTPDYSGPSTAFVGRTTASADGGTLLSWAGSGVSTRFDGGSIDVALKLTDTSSSNFFQIYLDQNAAGRLEITQDTSHYTITAPDTGVHSLSLIKETEAALGTASFQGFAARGQQYPTALPTGRKIEFIGDSLVCGFGNLGLITTKMLTSTTDPNRLNQRSCLDFLGLPDTATSSASNSFGAQAAKHFMADWRLICGSGLGVYRNSDDSHDNTLADVYRRSSALDGNMTYDLKSWVPQVVVINAGTTDFGSLSQSTAGPPSVTAFVAAYKKLLVTVRTAYPDAWIFLTAGPMLSDYYPTTFKALTTMRQALKGLVNEGDARVKYLEFASFLTTDIDPSGCDWLPSASQDADLAIAVQGAIQKYLGWQ